MDAFSLDDYRLHNAVTVEGSDPLVVSTPTARWAYAVEFPRREGEDLAAGPVVVRVDLTVRSGTIGVGCLRNDGAFILERERNAADGNTHIDFALTSLASCRSLIVRNTSPDHHASTVEIVGIRVHAEGQAPDRRLEISVDLSIAETFAPWSGMTPAGFVTDWLGVRTRAEVQTITNHRLESHMERHERPRLATDRPMVLEWVSLLRAVHTAGPTFVVVELGAAWGPWLSAGALAARRTHREYRLIGVEPEPSHFGWLRRHLDDNGVEPDRCRLIEAAVARHRGVGWLRVGDPAGWYGQSMLPEAATPDIDVDTVPLGAVIETNGMRLRRTQIVELEDVVGGVTLIDYLHLDIQGSEFEVLAASRELLRERVKMVYVATHSELIERDLRRLFTSMGWVCHCDVPLAATVLFRFAAGPVSSVTFRDGAQIWVNASL